MNQLHARIKELFLQACRLSPEEREVFLEQVCADAPEIREEVQALLRHHVPQTILASLTVELKPRTVRHPPPHAVSAVATGSLAESPDGKQRLRRLISSGAAARPKALLQRLLGTPGGRVSAVLAVGLALAVLAIVAHQELKDSLKQIRSQELTTILRADATALRNWAEGQGRDVLIVAHDRELQQAALRLLQDSDLPAPQLREHVDAAVIRQEIQWALERASSEQRAGYERFVVFDRVRILAASEPELVGQAIAAGGAGLVAEVFRGETVPTPPRPSDPLTETPAAERSVPLVSFAAPIRDDARQVRAGLLVSFSSQGFNEILSIAQMGRTGETYAFDLQGRLVSESRFADDLLGMRLIEPHLGADGDMETQTSFQVWVHDPGRSLERFPLRDSEDPATFPRTQIAEHALTRLEDWQRGESFGYRVVSEPYRDYRGVRVIGAYTWLPEFDLVLVTEVNADEAFAPLAVLYLISGTLFVLLVGAVVAAYFSTCSVVDLQERVGEAEQLGQYRLEERIGEGGMGVVCKAQHMLLRRATAIKILKPQATAAGQERFAREVKLAARLTHPNTIEIYDYGRITDTGSGVSHGAAREGEFFYAMEFVSGLTLEALIALEGRLPPARVVFLIRQVCLSLREAHAIRLIHRDIKPANIMVCARGGEYDVIKVLDFGLAKDLAQDATLQVTGQNLVLGTPLYMSPERLTPGAAVDARCDIYALGAVMYKLLTGRPIFESQNLAEACDDTLNTPPPRPSDAPGVSIPAELDELVWRCLAKQPADRPPSIHAILETLDQLALERPWSQADAAAWWDVLFGILPEPAESDLGETQSPTATLSPG